MVQTRSRAQSRPNSRKKAKSFCKPSSSSSREIDEQIEDGNSIGKSSVFDKHILTVSMEDQSVGVNYATDNDVEDGLGEAEKLQLAGIVDSISLGNFLNKGDEPVFNEEDLELESMELVSQGVPNEAVFDVPNDVVSDEEYLEESTEFVSQDVPNDVVSDEEYLEESTELGSEDLLNEDVSDDQPEYIDFVDEGLNKERKVVHFNDKGQPIGEGSAPFCSELGSIMRKHCPISYETWRGVPGPIKDKLWKHVTDKYIVPDAYKLNVLGKIHNYWRSHKSLLRTKHYDKYNTDDERKKNCPKGVTQVVWNKFVDNQSSPVAQARRTAGKIARQAMKTPHVSGRTGAARMAEALKRGNPSANVTRTDLYLAMHSRSDGSCPTPELAEKVEKIKTIAKENPSSINLDVDHDPVAQVYGPERSGRSVRGMGVGVSKASLLHSAPAMDQLQEERRLRIAAQEEAADLKLQIVSSESAETHSSAACWFTPILKKRNSSLNQNKSIHGSTSSSKKRKGFEEDDAESDYEEAPITKKKAVEFNDKGQPIGEGASCFISEIGHIVRKHCPVSYENWRDVPDPTKDALVKLVTDKYIVPLAYKQKILERLLSCWRNHKSQLRTKHYDRYDTDEERKRNRPKGVTQEAWNKFVDNESSPAAQARRAAGKFARQAMKTPHVSGRTGAARLAEALKKKNPSGTVTRTELYLAMHSRKDGSCPTPELTEKVEKIKAITKENPDSVNLDIDHDPVAQVYGREKSGHGVRGMGLGVSKISLRHSAPALHQLENEKRLRAAAEQKVAKLKKQVASLSSTPSVDNPEEDRRSHLFSSSSKPKTEKDLGVSNISLRHSDPALRQLEQEKRLRAAAEEKVNKLKAQVASLSSSPNVENPEEDSRSHLFSSSSKPKIVIPPMKETRFFYSRKKPITPPKPVEETSGKSTVEVEERWSLRKKARVDRKQHIESDAGDTETEDEDYMPESQMPNPRVVEERRVDLSLAEEQLAMLKEQVVSQKEQIGELRQEKEEMSELKEQIKSQGLMIADMKELIARLCS